MGQAFATSVAQPLVALSFSVLSHLNLSFSVAVSEPRRAFFSISSALKFFSLDSNRRVRLAILGGASKLFLEKLTSL